MFRVAYSTVLMVVVLVAWPEAGLSQARIEDDSGSVAVSEGPNGLVPANVPAGVAQEEGEHFEAVRQCCECLCVPQYPDPFCYEGECIWVLVSDPCPAGYIEPSECPEDAGQGGLDPNLPPYLEVGDLIFIEARPWVDFVFHTEVPGWDHIAMYTGDGLFIEAGNYPGTRVVTYAPLAFYLLWAEEIAYGKVVTAEEGQRLGAVEFAVEQLYLPYQDAYECWWANPDPDDPDDPYSDAWYCSELVWAAYWHQGINIDATPEPPSPEEGGDGVHLYVSPQDIADDDDVALYTNSPPATPARPSGPTEVRRLQTRLYFTSTTDPDNDLVKYKWDWDEGRIAWDFLFHRSGVTATKAHTWVCLGYHEVRVKAKDIWGNESPWSPTLTVLVRGWLGGSLETGVIGASSGDSTAGETGADAPIPEPSLVNEGG